MGLQGERSALTTPKLVFIQDRLLMLLVRTLQILKELLSHDSNTASNIFPPNTAAARGWS